LAQNELPFFCGMRVYIRKVIVLALESNWTWFLRLLSSQREVFEQLTAIFDKIRRIRLINEGSFEHPHNSAVFFKRGLEVYRGRRFVSEVISALLALKWYYAVPLFGK
jgi:hypothetical protein